MKNLPVVRFAYPNDFRKKRKRITSHFERMIKVKSGCVRKWSDGKEVAAQPLE